VARISHRPFSDGSIGRFFSAVYRLGSRLNVTPSLAEELEIGRRVGDTLVDGISAVADPSVSRWDRCFVVGCDDSTTAD